MQAERIISLGEDGIFTALAKGAVCRLMFDSENGSVRWLLIYTQDGTDVDHVLSIHSSLDAGLVALADQAGWDSKRFSVSLPPDDSFTRPGKVPAEEILAAYGYMLAGTIVAYAVYDPAFPISDPVEAAAAVRSQLAGRPILLGSVEPIGVDDTGWCCDFSIPFEGYIHKDAVEPMVDDLLAGADLEVVSVIEGDWFGSEAPNVASVIHAFPEAA